MTIPQAASVNLWREALAAPEPEPVAWKHDCAALCTNDVELWIDACPHCGKPRTAPPAAPAPAAPVPDGWVMVPRGLLRRLIAEALTFDPSLQDKEAIEQAKQLAASPAAPVVREPLRDDAFHAWVEEASADHPNLLERQEFRDAMYNAWINGYNTRVDEQAHGITGASK